MRPDVDKALLLWLFGRTPECPPLTQLLEAVYTSGASPEGSAVLEHGVTCFHCRLEICLLEVFLRGEPVFASGEVIAHVLARLKLPGQT